MKNETKVQEKPDTIGHYREETEKVKKALLSTLAAAKTNIESDQIFVAHSDLLPALFSGWIASDECAALAPHYRASTFALYTALVNLLSDLDEVLDRIPLDILKSHA